MKITMTRAMISCLLIMFLWGCSSKVYMHPLLVTETSNASAEVYFFRKTTGFAALVSILIYLEGSKLVQLRNNTYSKVYLKPGIYDVTVGEDREEVGYPAFTRNFHFVAGQTYFVLLIPEHLRRSFFGPPPRVLRFFRPQLINAIEAESLKAELTEVN